MTTRHLRVSGSDPVEGKQRSWEPTQYPPLSGALGDVTPASGKGGIVHCAMSGGVLRASHTFAVSSSHPSYEPTLSDPHLTANEGDHED